MINDEFANDYSKTNRNSHSVFTHVEKNYPPQYKWVLNVKFLVLSHKLETQNSKLKTLLRGTEGTLHKVAYE
jgi:hypothetical protein